MWPLLIVNEPHELLFFLCEQGESHFIEGVVFASYALCMGHGTQSDKLCTKIANSIDPKRCSGLQSVVPVISAPGSPAVTVCIIKTTTSCHKLIVFDTCNDCCGNSFANASVFFQNIVSNISPQC